jgi:hypothetical protein
VSLFIFGARVFVSFGFIAKLHSGSPQFLVKKFADTFLKIISTRRTSPTLLHFRRGDQFQIPIRLGELERVFNCSPAPIHAALNNG